MWNIYNTESTPSYRPLPEILQRPQQRLHNHHTVEVHKQEETNKEQTVKKVKLKAQLPIIPRIQRQLSQITITTTTKHTIQPQKKKQEILIQVNIPQTTKPQTELQQLIVKRPETKESLIMPKRKIKCVEDYEIGEILGQGSYATVRLGTHQQTNKKVAIKMYQKDRLMDPQRARAVAKEIQILRMCKHNNIIQIIKVVETPKYINLILDYGGDMSLKKLKQKHLSNDDIQHIYQQLMQAVQYLHNLHIIHRDIKLENILINNQKDIKLIDFGFATQFEEMLTTTYGTPSYMSPEMLPPLAKYNEKTDIWSCGIVLYYLVYGKFPFYGHTERELQYKIKKSDIQYGEIDDEIQQVLVACLEKNYEERKNAQQVLKIMWMPTYY